MEREKEKKKKKKENKGKNVAKVPNSMMVIWQQRADDGDTMVGLRWKREEVDQK